MTELLHSVVVTCIIGAALCFVYACVSLGFDLRLRSKAEPAVKAKMTALPRSADRVAALVVAVLLLLVAAGAAAVHDKVA